MTLYLPNNWFCNRIRRVANLCLERAGYTFEYRGTRFKIHSLTQATMAYSMFRHDLGHHPDFIHDSEIRGLCDLGCNAGFFTLWVQRRWPALRALLVDANPAVTATAAHNMLLNGIPALVQTGLVGEKRSAFHIADSDQLSCTHPLQWMETKYTRTILAHAVHVPTLWRASPAAPHPDLLKIDIEGSELNFISEHPAFIQTFRRVIVEWHAPRVTEAAVRQHLQALGFDELHATRNQFMGLVYFRNKQPVLCTPSTKPKSSPSCAPSSPDSSPTSILPTGPATTPPASKANTANSATASSSGNTPTNSPASTPSATSSNASPP